MKGIARQSLITFDEKSVEAHSVGQMKHSCNACGELMFKNGKSNPVQGDKSKSIYSLCCAYGTIKLPPIKEPPKKFKCLLTGKTRKDNEVRTNIRA